VVTSEIKPMTEYIRHGENGLLLHDHQNPEAMANVISEACCNRDLRRKLRHNAPESIANFEREKIDALEVNYYQRILIERNNRPQMRIPILSKFFDKTRYHNLPFEEAAMQRAVDWVRRYTIPHEGICINSLQKISYPEVTGYFIPTLLAMNEEGLAVQYARYLMRIQNDDGSWNGPTWPNPERIDCDPSDPPGGLARAAQRMRLARNSGWTDWGHFDADSRRASDG
jgi:hypothetical protein